MNAKVPNQATWRTSDKSPWWLRSSKYNQPNGDYRANCFMDLFRRPTSESAVQFRAAAPLKDGEYAHKGCSFSSRSYYCQPIFVKPKPKKVKPAPPPHRRVVPYTNLRRGLQEEVFYFTQGKKVPSFRASNVLREVRRVYHASTSNKWAFFTKSQDFAVRWSGFLIIPKGGKYGLQITSDDGSNLYIDGRKKIDNDGQHGMNSKSYSSKFVKGQHPVRIEYFQKGGKAGMMFRYKNLAQKKSPWKTVTAKMLRHLNTPGLKEEIYYGGKYSKVPDLNKKTANVQRFVPVVNYRSSKAKWRGFTKSENFAVRWSGFLNIIKTGTYKFGITSDDGSNLYLNGRKRVDNDGLHGMRAKEVTVSLAGGGKNKVVFTYFNKGGKAGMIFKYMGPDTDMKMIVVPPKATKVRFSRTSTPAPKKRKAKKGTSSKRKIAVDEGGAPLTAR